MGAGNSTAAAASLPDADNVSPVSTLPSFDTEPISPAIISPASSCFPPLSHIILESRSSAPVRLFIRRESFLIFPESTRKYESLPTNGSAMVLNTKSAFSPFSSKAFSSPPSKRQTASAAEGRILSSVSTISGTAAPVCWIPAKTGHISPEATPFFSPSIISSGANSSPAKYFSISASSAVAIASKSMLRISSASLLTGMRSSLSSKPSQA